MFFLKLEQTPSVASHRVLSPLYSTRKMSRSAFSHVLGHHKCMPSTRWKTPECRNAIRRPTLRMQKTLMFEDLPTCSGWWYTYPSEKYEFVSWDDCSIPNWMDSHKIPWFQSTNQHSLTIVISTYIYHKPQNSAIYRFQSPPTSVPGWIDRSFPVHFAQVRSTRYGIGPSDGHVSRCYRLRW